MRTPDPDSWERYSKLVLSELNRIDTDLRVGQASIEKRLRNIEMEIALLKVKSGLWGGLAGMIPIVIFLVIGK